jgi:hypothetical protein
VLQVVEDEQELAGLERAGERGGDRLDAAYSLPQSCENQQVAKWDGSAWVCGNDNDTTYSAGTGLDLNETEFRIQAQYRVQNDPDCPSGQFATGFNADGDIQCAAPSVSGPEVWVTRVDRGEAPGTGPPGLLIAQLTLPPGQFLASAAAIATSDSGDEDLSVECNLRVNGATSPAIVLADAWGSIRNQSLAMSDAFGLSATGTLELRCWSRDGNNHVESVRLIATKAGAVHTQ